MLEFHTNSEMVLKNNYKLKYTDMLSKDTLMSYITDFQCPEYLLLYIKNNLIFRDICKMIEIDYSSLITKFEDNLPNEVCEQINKMLKFYGFGIEYTICDTLFDKSFEVLLFNDLITEKSKLNIELDRKLEFSEITEEEYDQEFEDIMVRFGCLVYLNDVFNENFMFNNQDDIQMISEDIYGKFYLYEKNDIKQDEEFLESLNKIKEFFSKEEKGNKDGK